MFRSRQANLIPNPLGAALTVYSVFFAFFGSCSLISLAMHLLGVE